ncbi:superinfection exclusion B family protein [Spartinivicinus ruber]|uniref:superinfection exclusion B family protein n=1 Tax=Spartinivicinus ruber TaxID=2683272 RepID=UPI0013D8B469|nr:superinfection exclusion B family protein [Spartinivicinus ruber]
MDLLSWIKAPREVVWPLIIVSCLLLWGPGWFVQGLGLESFIDEYRKWLGVVFLFFLIVGIQPAIPSAYKKIIKMIDTRKRLNKATEEISNLTPKEKEILRYYIINNIRTQDLSIQDGNVNILISKGFLILASSVSYGGMKGSFTFPVNITDWTWNYIRKNPNVLED